MEKRLLKKIAIHLLIIEILSLLLICYLLHMQVSNRIYTNMEHLLMQEAQFYLESRKIREEQQAVYAVSDGILSDAPENVMEDLREWYGGNIGFLQYVSAIEGESLFAVDPATGLVLDKSQSNDPTLDLSVLGDTKEMLALIEDDHGGRMLWIGHQPVLLKSRPVDDMIFVDLRRLNAQIRQTLWMMFGITAVLTLIMVMLIGVIRWYFRKYVFDEIDAIQNTVRRQMAGDERVVFQTDCDTEMGLIAAALNEWSRNIRLKQRKLNWILNAAAVNAAAFEAEGSGKRIYRTDNFQTILGASDAQWDCVRKNTKAFLAYMEKLNAGKDPEGIVEVNDRMLRIELYRMEEDYFGILMDKTEEIKRKSRQSRELQKAVNASESDCLTGLMNRRGFENHARQRILDQPGSAVMLMLDADNFKLVNDTLGHPVGDQMLNRIAEVLRKQFRNNDIAARLGGDEFIVLIKPSMSPERLNEKLQLLLKVMDKELSEFGDEMSVSIGAAWTKETIMEYEQMYQWADEALYSAKRAGKRQYVIMEH